MIITRTMDKVEFQLGESRRIGVDISRIASAALTFERQAGGKLSPVLMLMHGVGQMSERIEARAEQLIAMHARIVELMTEIAGPALTRPGMVASTEDDGFSV